VSVSEAVVPIPVEYLPTGDHALLVAWSANVRAMGAQPRAVLCLEDGSAVLAALGDFRFDFRWDERKQQFVDVSGVLVAHEDAQLSEEDIEGADTDQEPTDDGGEGVSGSVPEAD
jgi:hypothetical protein